MRLSIQIKAFGFSQKRCHYFLSLRSSLHSSVVSEEYGRDIQMNDHYELPTCHGTVVLQNHCVSITPFIFPVFLMLVIS